MCDIIEKEEDVLQRTDINLFFEYLAERKYHENDLSDITYALCYSNDFFRKCFLNFCFDVHDDSVDTLDLKREYQVDDSRPDFYFFDLKGKERLIEVKINDRNQHPKYTDKFENAEYAFIANYSNPPGLGEKWKKTTWKNFHAFLSDQNKNEKDDIISGYLVYLKNLIDLKEFKVMNLLDNYTSLPIFYDNIVGLMGKYGIDVYPSNLKKDINYFGELFLKKDNNGKINNDLWFWFGIYLPEKEAIYLGFESKNASFPQNIKEAIEKAPRETLYYSKVLNKPDGNQGDAWFKLQPKQYNALCNTDDSEKQKNILEDFFLSVFKDIDADKYLK